MQQEISFATSRRHALLYAWCLLFCAVAFMAAANAVAGDDPAKTKPAIEGFYPHCIAPGKNGAYYFKIMGRNFGIADNAKGFPMILFDGGNVGVEWMPSAPSDQDKEGIAPAADASKVGASAAGIKGFIHENSREIEIWGLPNKIAHGKMLVKVERADGAFSDAAELRLAYVSDTTAKWLAAVVTALIFLIPILSTAKKQSSYTIGGTPQKLWSVFLLDAESNSYSLSKLQFYLWTFAGVFGYVFLTVARSLVQGRFEFADIPENLPAIIFVSATTTVVAAGATALKGPKGAGDEQPGFSDFVCAGGIVIAERFQFLVWTALGVGAFVFMILFSDAASITALPAIPQQFLMLMGISSAGYLGGKLVRKPGPVIDSIVPNVTRSNPVAPAAVGNIASLVLEIRGTVLSKDASFKIDDHEVKFQKMLGVAPNQAPNPDSVEKADDFATSGFAKVLKLTLDAALNPWLATLSVGNRQLTIINPDGKLATWAFTV